MDTSLFSITVILFLIMDPLGNIPSLLRLTNDLERKRFYWVVVREMLIALIVMVIFNFLGEWILDLLHISEVTVKFTSAVILFLTAIKILFPATNSLRANLPAGEPFIIPLAVPLIAGPSLMATIMLFAHIVCCQSLMMEAIFIAWVLALAILLCGKTLKRFLGDNGLIACERLTGMFLVMLAIQRFMDGLHQFLSAYA